MNRRVLSILVGVFTLIAYNNREQARLGPAAVVLDLAPEVQAQTCTGWSNQLVPMDFETITVSTAAVGFTSSKIVNTTTGLSASYAFFTLETADIRYRVDGVDPTAAIGHAAAATGSGFFVCGAQAVKAFRAIRSGGADSTMRVTYFRGA